MSLLFELDTNKLPWEKWSWDVPQQPNGFFFRRHQQMPIKNVNSPCECPPHEECEVEYKLNKDYLHFLHIQGLINKTEDVIEETTEQEPLHQLVKNRRKRDEPNNISKKECCCPPSNLMMPTFISNKKYDDFIERFDKKQDVGFGIQDKVH